VSPGSPAQSHSCSDLPQTPHLLLLVHLPARVGPRRQWLQAPSRRLSALRSTVAQLTPV